MPPNASKRNPKPLRDRKDYTVGIVCALEKEAIAVQSTFDYFFLEKSDRVKTAEGDGNYYSFGTIADYHVVLAHMGDMGGIEAAEVASNMRRSFPNIKLCLVVGICGIVPKIEGQETLLGDVVISKCVKQYDRGKEYPSGFHSINMLGEAPLHLKRALSGLATPQPLKSFCLELKSHLWVLMEHEDMVEREYCYPGHRTDYLYEPEYIHEHRSQECAVCRAKSYCQTAVDASCKDLACSEDKLINRKRLEQLETARNAPGITAGQANTRDRGMPYPLGLAPPKVWLGNVASGKKVMKNGTMRDEVAREHNVMAFEMEGAGTWNIFPTIVIKAACDYADSHKNKFWQKWAAMTAAACAKAFLVQLQMGIPQNVEYAPGGHNGQDSSAGIPQSTTPQSKQSSVSQNSTGNFYGQNQSTGDVFKNTGFSETRENYNADPSLGLSFSNYGPGLQFNAPGGTQNNNTGGGSQFLGNFSGPVNFSS